MHNHHKRKTPKLGLRESSEQIYPKILSKIVGQTSLEEKDVLMGHIRARRYDLLLQWSELVTPQKYCNPASYFAAAQVSSLIKKYPFSPDMLPGLNPEETAVKKFLHAEHRCKRVNLIRILKRKRFDHYAQFWADARSYIRRVLGDKPDLPRIYAQCDFSSGASLGVHGNKTNLARKFSSESWTCTPSARLYAIPALWANAQIRNLILQGEIVCYDQEQFVRDVDSRIEYVHYNKVSFVPKTAKTHRSIAIEPLLNGYLQKGVDQFMRQRLLKYGIDLSDQDRNRTLAKYGSIDLKNPYCTIDLSAASDSISIQICRDLLPKDWFLFLNEIRSPSYMLGNNVVSYHKFCSMGNGFCFPLESLLFSSLCYAVLRSMNVTDPYDFSVYGDDIIIRQDASLLLIEVLKVAGFAINREKSFLFGPFRESCGADWYTGQDVRPVVLDKPLTDLRQVFALHNSFLRSTSTELISDDLRSYLLSLSNGRYMRPGKEPGDTAFSVPLDVAMQCPDVRWDRHLQNWRWREVSSRPIRDRLRDLSMEFNSLQELEWLSVLRGASSSQPLSFRYLSRPRIVSVSRPWKDERTPFSYKDTEFRPVFMLDKDHNIWFGQARQPVYDSTDIVKVSRLRA